jgi:hypothetical protein
LRLKIEGSGFGLSGLGFRIVEGKEALIMSFSERNPAPLFLVGQRECVMERVHV